MRRRSVLPIFTARHYVVTIAQHEIGVYLHFQQDQKGTLCISNICNSSRTSYRSFHGDVVPMPTLPPPGFNSSGIVIDLLIECRFCLFDLQGI